MSPDLINRVLPGAGVFASEVCRYTRGSSAGPSNSAPDALPHNDAASRNVSGRDSRSWSRITGNSLAGARAHYSLESPSKRVRRASYARFPRQARMISLVFCRSPGSSKPFPRSKHSRSESEVDRKTGTRASWNGSVLVELNPIRLVQSEAYPACLTAPRTRGFSRPPGAEKC